MINKEKYYSLADSEGKLVGYDVEQDLLYSTNSIVNSFCGNNKKSVERLMDSVNDSFNNEGVYGYDDLIFPLRIVEIELFYKVVVSN